MKFSKLSLIGISLAFVLGGCNKNSGDSSSKSMSQVVPSSSQQTTSTPTPSSSTSSIQPDDHELIGKKYLFNGYIDQEITATKGDIQTIVTALEHYYGSEDEFILRVADHMVSYRETNSIFHLTPNKTLDFTTTKVSGARHLDDGTNVTTYLANPYQDDTGSYCLAEYGLDPRDNSYHLYDADETGLLEKIKIAVVNYFGNDDHIEVVDTKFVVNGPNVSVTYEISVFFDYVEATGTFTLKFGPGDSQDDVTIITQPKDIETTYPDGITLSVEVTHPEKVLSYSWWAGAYSDISTGNVVGMKPIGGEATYDSVLKIDGIGCAQHDIPFRCLIRTENRRFFTSLANVHVNGVDEYKPVAFLLDYPIRAGETLDLSDTPYGSGTIEYKANETEFVFTDVKFRNDHIKTDLQSLGFSLETWYNPHEEYTFTFNGQCEWHNYYWEEDAHQGGLNFFTHFPTSQGGVRPRFIFQGDPITFIGGSRSFSEDGDLVIKNKVNIIGHPGRLTHGLFADSITLEEGASLTGTIGGTIACAKRGNIELKKNSQIRAIVNPAKVSVGETQLFVLRALDQIIANDALIDLDTAIDYAFFKESAQNLSPAIAIESENGEFSAVNSNVNIRIAAINYPDDTGDDLLVNSAMGVCCPGVYFKNSNVNIDVGSYLFNNVYGIYSAFTDIIESNVNIRAQGIYNVNGISAINQIKPDHVSGTFTATNAKIHVNVSSIEHLTGNFIEAGIKSTKFNLDLTSDGYIEVTTNYASALVCIYNRFDNPVTPQNPYEAQHLIFDTSKMDVEIDPYNVNIGCYQGFDVDLKKDYYVAFELLFRGTTQEAYQTYLKLSHKKA